MLRLAHISDLHYSDSVNVPVSRLLNKRITGFVNFHLHRRFQYSRPLLDLVLGSIRDAKADHVVVTGDVSNLSLGAEFAGVRDLFERYGFRPRDVSVVPGNHDRYTKGSERAQRFEGYLMPFMSGDLPSGPHAFPYVRLRGEIAIIGINSALSLPPLLAGGQIGIEQLTRLEAVLHHPDARDRFPVILIHHPPYRHPRRSLHAMEGLQDFGDLLQAVAAPKALILHGHLHKNIHRKVTSDGKTFLVSGVSASSYRLGGPASTALSSFAMYDIDRQGIHSVRCFTYRAPEGRYEPAAVGEDAFLPAGL